MLTEARTLDTGEGSLSSAYIPDLCNFPQSESSAEPRLQVVQQTNQSLGISEYSRVPADRMIEVFRGLGESAVFLRDASFTTGFLGRELSVVVGSDETEDPASVGAKKAFRRVLESIREEVVEDGYTHRAERLVSAALDRYGERARRHITELVAGHDLPNALVAGLLRILGRQSPSAMPTEWFANVIGVALSSSDVAVRDAAVQAVELVEDDAALALLAKHAEPCDWLADYVAGVLDDLVGE